MRALCVSPRGWAGCVIPMARCSWLVGRWLFNRRYGNNIVYNIKCVTGKRDRRAWRTLLLLAHASTAHSRTASVIGGRCDWDVKRVPGKFVPGYRFRWYAAVPSGSTDYWRPTSTRRSVTVHTLPSSRHCRAREQCVSSGSRHAVQYFTPSHIQLITLL